MRVNVQQMSLAIMLGSELGQTDWIATIHGNLTLNN